MTRRCAASIMTQREPKERDAIKLEAKCYLYLILSILYVISNTEGYNIVIFDRFSMDVIFFNSAIIWAKNIYFKLYTDTKYHLNYYNNQNKSQTKRYNVYTT